MRKCAELGNPRRTTCGKTLNIQPEQQRVTEELVPLSSETQGTPWKGHQSIEGQYSGTQDKQTCTHPFTPKGNVERPFNLTVMFLNCGRKLEDPSRTHTCTRKTC
ncbi:hypothetical protein ILYODFUR_003754 [Ilyodon furcidens]|uniref:Uncharacterized protein n=1 Tax=Ilyodon furcidens TaxID=33524 RepID=A0ABV0SU79_9TELE